MALNYLSYTFQIHDYLMELKHLLQPYVDSAQVRTWVKDIDNLNAKLENMHFQVAVVGEFKRGKTSFINALLKKTVLPADVLPATATINRITYGNEPASYIYWNNGQSVTQIEIDQLSEYITKLTDNSAIQAQNIKEAVVRYPCRFCENNVDIIDTPGMNDDDDMNNITIRQLSDIDLAIVTLDPNAPVSNTEAHFIAQLVESDQICQIVFVVSKMDTLFYENRERLLKVIKERLKKLVKAALLEENDEKSPIIKKYSELFSEPIIFPVSSIKALHAYEMGDQEELISSGFQRLNDELLPLIICTQHKAAIVTPLNSIIHISEGFMKLLHAWEEQRLKENRVKTLKTEFAEIAENLPFDKKEIWSECLQYLDDLREERNNTAFFVLFDCANQYPNQKNVFVIKLKELFQKLSRELVQEERDSYYQVWNRYLCPKYNDLRQRLWNLVQPYPDIFQKIESGLNQLLSYTPPSETLTRYFKEPEAFYWETAPVPQEQMSSVQIAHLIDNAVQTSFLNYYQRRQLRLEEFADLIIKEQEKKTATLVQTLFQSAKTVVTLDSYIQVEYETYEKLNKQLVQLIRVCNITKENYMNESERR